VVAEPILREVVEEDAEPRWIQGCGQGRGGGGSEGPSEDEVEEWSDSSRNEERAAGATRSKGMYLGTMATVADAEELGVMLAWEDADRVALDSQGVIQRIWNLQDVDPRSWSEEARKRQMQERPRVLMWVKSHDGVVGNEEADMRAKKEVEMGWRLLKPDIVTPAGRRQAHPLHPRPPAHMR